MNNLDRTTFQNCLEELKRYQPSKNEIVFSNNKKTQNFSIVEKPNWLARIIRFIFKGGYKPSEAIKKVLDFLEANQQQLIGQENSVKELKENLIKELSGNEKIKISRRFTQLINRIDSLNSISSSSSHPLDKTIIDVPDDGNCLFYALSLGLGDRVDVNPEYFSSLKKEERANYLKNAADRLRKEAADYLETPTGDRITLILAMMEGVGSYQEALNNQLEEKKQVVELLEQEEGHDLETLKKEIEDLQQKVDADMSDAEYIADSRQNGFYCGTPQILALSHLYKVPISVETDDGVNVYGQGEGPPLRIAYVNGNHFQWIKSS